MVIFHGELLNLTQPWYRWPIEIDGLPIKNGDLLGFNHYFDGDLMVKNTQPGYDIHSSPWDFDGPNRNRWFTVLNSMVIFHGELLNLTQPWYRWPIEIDGLPIKNGDLLGFNHYFDGDLMVKNTQPGYDIHSSPWDFDGPNRNRWFTVLNSMVIFHGELLNLTQPWYRWPIEIDGLPIKNGDLLGFNHYFDGDLMVKNTQPGYDIHSSPWDFDGPNRNRWFTVLNSMVIFHGELLNLTQPWYRWPIEIDGLPIKNGDLLGFNHYFDGDLMVKNTQPGYDIHSSPWDFDGPNRNRWFTVLNSMVIFHGELLNLTQPWYRWPIEIDGLPIKNGDLLGFNHYFDGDLMVKNTQPGYDIHSSPWDFDGPNRNRWFTVLNSMVIFHGELLNLTQPWYRWPIEIDGLPIKNGDLLGFNHYKLMVI